MAATPKKKSKSSRKANSKIDNGLFTLLFILFLIFGAFIIGKYATAWYLTGSEYINAARKAVDTSEPIPFKPEDGNVLAIATEQDHRIGPEDAKVAIVEYSDLECPFCKTFHADVAKAIEKYGDVAWIYRHFPLPQLHKQAQIEAEATECANELGGSASFWAMLNTIFEETSSNDGFDLTRLPKIAATIGIDEASFSECLESGRHKEKVDRQHQSGLVAGVRSTPSAFVVVLDTNEYVTIRGAVPYEELTKTLDSVLKTVK